MFLPSTAIELTSKGRYSFVGVGLAALRPGDLSPQQVKYRWRRGRKVGKPGYVEYLQDAVGGIRSLVLLARPPFVK